MAIPILKAKAISRGNDEWVVAAASYRAGEKLYDDRAGKSHDYSGRSGVRESGIELAANAPAWAADRGQLWNAVEANEKRKDAQLAKEVTVALPNELNEEEQKSFLISYINGTFTEKGIVVDWAIHDPEPANPDDPRNPHAHLLFPLRTFDEGGEWSRYKSGGPDQPWDKKPFLYEMRSQWEAHQNAALEAAGSDERISMKSYAEQGLDRMGGVHLGKDAYAMEKKGVQTDRGDKQAEIEAYNAAKGWRETSATSTIERVRSRFSGPSEAAQAYQRTEYIIQEEFAAQDSTEKPTFEEHLDARAAEIQDFVTITSPPAIDIHREAAPFDPANDTQDMPMEPHDRDNELDAAQIKEIVDEKRVQDAQVASAFAQPAAEQVQQPVVVENPVDHTQEVEVPEAESAVVVDEPDQFEMPDEYDASAPVLEAEDDFEMPDEYDASAPVLEAEDDFEMPDGYGEMEVDDAEPIAEEPAPDIEDPGVDPAM